jgi:DNA polymerase III subunit beta
MRITASRKDLLAPLTNAASVVPSRPTKESLAFIRLKSKAAGVLQIHATDLEVHLRDTLTVDCEPGEIALPAAQLLAVVRSLPDGDVVISSGDTSATVSGNGSEFTLPLGSVEALPDFPESKEDCTELESVPLSAAFSAVGYAASNDSARFSMNGVRVLRDGDHLEFVATDGRRLAMFKAKVKIWGATGADGVTVPNKVVDLIIRNPGEAGIAWTRNGILVEWFSDDQSTELASVVLDGRFPDYKAVLPKEDAVSSAVVDAPVLADGIKRAALLVDQETRRLNVKLRSGGMTLAGKTSSGAASKIEHSCDVVGEKLDMSFNPAYLADALKYAPDTEVRIGFFGENKPCLCVAGDYRVLVMPLI